VRRWPGLLAAAAVGAVAGSLVVLALPVPGSIDEPVAPALPPVEPVKVDTLLVWTPTQIPSGLPERVERLRSVAAVTVVRSGVAWLDAWGAEDLIVNAPSGYAIPVEVAAIDTTTYRDFVPPADRPAIASLQRGGAILGDSSATLRELDVGGHLRLGSTVVSVEGVLDDTLVGAHELVVGLDEGRILGIDRARYILVEPRDGADPSTVEAAIRRAVPADVRVRIRRPGETPVFRHGDAVLPQVRIKELFGEFAASPRGDGTLAVDPGWERENIVTGPVPVLGQVRCHRLVLPLVRAALEDLESRGLGRLVNPADFGGCYYPRYIASDEGSGISHHSWGIAIDINVSEGLPGRQPTLDRRVVDAFENQGFIWGGRFLIPDGTHFEFQRFP
jgi:D-alanyl-D-alanine carboxypeptidase-like protein